MQYDNIKHRETSRDAGIYMQPDREGSVHLGIVGVDVSNVYPRLWEWRDVQPTFTVRKQNRVCITTKSTLQARDRAQTQTNRSSACFLETQKRRKKRWEQQRA